MARRRQRDKKRTPFVGVKACCGTCLRSFAIMVIIQTATQIENIRRILVDKTVI